jgi:hypothetical protein
MNKMEINNLSKEELVKLKQEVDDRLKTIEVKEITFGTRGRTREIRIKC